MDPEMLKLFGQMMEQTGGDAEVNALFNHLDAVEKGEGFENRSGSEEDEEGEVVIALPESFDRKD